jgi:hypothetical protein
MKPRTTLRTSSLLLLLAATATASFPQGHPPQRGKQDGGDAPYDQARLSLKALRRASASQLVAYTADAASGWIDRKAAVRVLAEAADLLWDEDPARARTWLKRAWELAGELADETEGTAIARFRSTSPKTRGRGVVLAVAQRRDKEFAERLLEQLADEERQAGHKSRQGVFDDKTARSEQLLDLALAIVKSDPNAAACLAELSLADGISFRLQSVLLALREQDKVVADRLFDSALGRLASRPHEPGEAQVIASYLFTPGRVAGVGSDNVAAMAVSARKAAESGTPAEDDSARARRFLNIVQQNLLSLPAPSTAANPALRAREVVFLADTLEPGFQLYAPDLWTPVEQRVAAIIPDLTPPPDAGLPQPVRRSLESGNSKTAGAAELNRLYVDGLEEAAEKESDPIARKLAYVRAAMATSPDDLPRGLSLASKIGEGDLRKQISSSLVYRAALAAIEKGQLDRATDLASTAEPLQQALVFIAVAQRFVTRQRDEDDVQAATRKARAVELLADAEKVLKRVGGSSEAVRARLGLVAALAPLDAPRALYFLKDAVTAINQMDSFDPADTSPLRVGVLYGPAAQPTPSAIRSGFGLQDACSALSRFEFEETVHIAGKLKAPHARGICMMEIARAILTEDASSR